MQDKIKCPLCPAGGDVVILESHDTQNTTYYHTHCRLCGVMIWGHSDTKEDAIEEWEQYASKLPKWARLKSGDKVYAEVDQWGECLSLCTVEQVFFDRGYVLAEALGMSNRIIRPDWIKVYPGESVEEYEQEGE